MVRALAAFAACPVILLLSSCRLLPSLTGPDSVLPGGTSGFEIASELIGEYDQGKIRNGHFVPAAMDSTELSIASDQVRHTVGLFITKSFSAKGGDGQLIIRYNTTGLIAVGWNYLIDDSLLYLQSANDGVKATVDTSEASDPDVYKKR